MIAPQPLPWVWDDGGREEAGYRGRAGDCVVRAVAIATRQPYREVYEVLFDAQRRLYYASRADGKKSSASPRSGVDPKVIRAYLAEYGWTWTPAMTIGSGCTHHPVVGEIPDAPRLILRLSRHLAAVIDGVLHDTYDPTRDGTRCVYGWWTP
jgi:hypothetical protein